MEEAKKTPVFPTIVLRDRRTDLRRGQLDGASGATGEAVTIVHNSPA